MARVRRADVDPGVEDMRTMDSPNITKSAQEPGLTEKNLITSGAAWIH
jgi:hypothetical protein